jgi:hypothetical protein
MPRILAGRYSELFISSLRFGSDSPPLRCEPIPERCAKRPMAGHPPIVGAEERTRVHSRAMVGLAAVCRLCPPLFAATSLALSTTSYTETKLNAGAPAAPKQNGMIGERMTAAGWTLFQSLEIDMLAKEAIAGSPTLERATVGLPAAQADALPDRGDDNV